MQELKDRDYFVPYYVLAGRKYRLDWRTISDIVNVTVPPLMSYPHACDLLDGYMTARIDKPDSEEDVSESDVEELLETAQSYVDELPYSSSEVENPVGAFVDGLSDNEVGLLTTIFVGQDRAVLKSYLKSMPKECFEALVKLLG